ncbi:MAG: General stress protein 14 [Betaproteobacteria bacterium ADurb.Bin341]|nr:MAG: General stress protein 14 [Betaproteobacteria bacterium ADurb.Bin341]
MPKVLINYGHRRPQESKFNARLIAAVSDLPRVTINDLGTRYPDLNIDGEHERALLLAHDIVVLQFPFYWYHTPAILKEWQDEALSFGFAYGPGGDKLKGKSMMVAMTTGGPVEAYQHGGYNQFTFDELLLPLHATANLTGMHWLPPFISAGVLSKTPEQFEAEIAEYRERISALTNPS